MQTSTASPRERGYLGSASGMVEARFEGPGVRESLFHVTRGNLKYMLEACSASGDVGLPEIVRHDDSGALVQFKARWA